MLLLDLEMPWMDGLQALKILHAEGYLTKTTVVMFSSLTDAEVVKEAYKYGARFYLAKPVGGEEYRDLAKLCIVCANVKLNDPKIDWLNTALPVGRALEMVLSTCPSTIR